MRHPDGRDPLSLLVVSYHFPPMAATGALRPARLLRYLPDDIRVTVLTVGNPPEPGGNEALALTLASRVRRVEAPLLPCALQRHVEGALARTGPAGLSAKLLNTLGSWFIWIPDRQVAWTRGTIQAGARILEETRADVLLSTSPPHSAHIAAATLARHFDIPLVVDFRDPWLGNPERRWPSPAHRLYERRLEARVLRAADLVIANTPGAARSLRREFPWLPESRVRVLPNGFDPERRTAIRQAPRQRRSDGRLEILYTGHLYASAAAALRGLRALPERDPDLSGRVVFRFVGSVDPPSARLLEPLEHTRLVERSPPVPPDSVPRLLASADALLYIVPPAGRDWIPSKLYEYLVAAKPILAILPRGDAWELLGRTGNAVLIDVAQPPSSIATALRDALGRLAAGEIPAEPAPDVVAPFDARVQAGQLAQWLREVVRGTCAQHAGAWRPRA